MTLLRSLMLMLRLLVLLAVVALTVSFAVGNRHLVDISLPPFTSLLSVPAYAFALGVFLIGVIAGVMSCLIHYNRKLWKLYRQTRRLGQENEALQKQVDSLSTEQYARQQMQRHIVQLEHAAE